MQIIEAIRKRFAQRAADGIESVIASARAIAAGSNADPAAVEATLVNAGVDVGLFEELVDLARRRSADRRLVAAGPAAESASIKIGTDIDRIADAADKAFEEAKEKIRALRQQQAPHDQAVRDAAEARARLLDEVPGAVGATLDAAKQEKVSATEALEAMRREIINVERLIDDHADSAAVAAGKGNSLDEDEYQRAKKRAERRLDDLKKSLPEAERRSRSAATDLRKAEAAAIEA